MSVLVLFALSVGFGLLFQRLMRGVVSASIVAAFVSAFAYYAIDFLIEGRLDSFVLLSFVTTTIVAYVIALSIGTMMRRAGKKP
jgi:hypothetical protein